MINKLLKFNILLAIIISSITISSTVYAESLTVVSFGGAYGAAQKKHMIDPFVKKYGVKVLFEDYSGGVAELKAQVESGNVKWDVLDIEYIDLARACSEGMLEELPLDSLPKGENGVAAKDDFIDNALNECAVGNIVWSIVTGYRNDISKKPTTIKDFFDTKKIPGKRAMRKRPQVNLEWALLADGVAKSKVYEVLATEAGVTRAFKKLDTIKKDVIWFDSWSQVPQLLNDGSVVLAQSANGRLYDAIKKKEGDFAIMWDGQVYDLDGWAIPKGSKNKDAAWKFIRFSTNTIPLSGMQDVSYGPTRKSSRKYLTEEVKPNLPSAHLTKGVKVDGDFWADNGSALAERFTAWSIK